MKHTIQCNTPFNIPCIYLLSYLTTELSALSVQHVVELLDKVLDLVDLNFHHGAREAVLSEVGACFTRSQLERRTKRAIKSNQQDKSALHLNVTGTIMPANTYFRWISPGVEGHVSPTTRKQFWAGLRVMSNNGTMLLFATGASSSASPSSPFSPSSPCGFLRAGALGPPTCRLHGER